MPIPEIIEEVKKLNVMELAELVKALEDKFGVSAAAPVAMAAVAAAPGAAAEQEEEQTEFTVMLEEIGDQKIQVIKAVRELTSLGLREAKEVVDSAPSEILKDVSKEQAEAAKERIESAGAKVTIK